MESCPLYVLEACVLNKRRKILIRSYRIREWINMKGTINDKIKRRKLLWNGQMQRMNEVRIPLTTWKWEPNRRKKRGRPRLLWNRQLKTAMRKIGPTREDINNKKKWLLGYGKRQIEYAVWSRRWVTKYVIQFWNQSLFMSHPVCGYNYDYWLEFVFP